MDAGTNVAGGAGTTVPPTSERSGAGTRPGPYSGGREAGLAGATGWVCIGMSEGVAASASRAS